ncbi:MAG TPA: cytochrome C oxidase subunit IV family protein [Tepidisphaeraceae bacterium]|jgi:cytochrome c oxidase subunit 4
MTEHPREEHDHVVSPTIYIAVLLTLMALLGLTLVAAFIDLDEHMARIMTGWTGRPHAPEAMYWNMGVALLIAITKAGLIILFFMHIKYGSRLAWAFAAAGFVWLGILLTLTLADYLSRNYPPGAPKGPPQYPTPNLMRPEPRPNPEVPGASAAPIQPGLPDTGLSFWKNDNA